MELEGSELYVLKFINIKDVIYMVTISFEDVPSSIIIKSWRKALPGIQEAVEKNVNGNPWAEENV